MLDNSIYQNDAYAQALLQGARDIASSNTVDPIAFDNAYKQLEPALKAGENILILGAPQNGKSTAVALIANRYGIPFIPFSCDDGLQPSAVFGGMVPNPNKGVNGDDREFIWEDGPLMKAWRRGYWFDAEELLQLTPDRASMFMKVLDKMPFFVTKAGEVIPRHPNFRFIATGNPLCRGNKKQNQALMRRFGVKISVQELSAKGFLLLGKSKRPFIKDGFFNAGHQLASAVVAEAQRLGHPGESCGITQLTSLIGLLENDAEKLTIDVFKEKVKATFINVLIAAQVTEEQTSIFMGTPAVNGYVSVMFNEYMASPKAALAQPQQQQQTPPPVQPAQRPATSSGNDLFNKMRGVKI